MNNQPMESKEANRTIPLKRIGIIIGFVGSGGILGVFIYLIYRVTQISAHTFYGETYSKTWFYFGIGLTILGLIGCRIAIAKKIVGGILMLIGWFFSASGFLAQVGATESEIFPRLLSFISFILSILWLLGGILVLVAPTGKKLPKKVPIESTGVSPLKTIGIIMGFIGSGGILGFTIYAIVQISNTFGGLTNPPPRVYLLMCLVILGFIGCIIAITNQVVGGILMLIGWALPGISALTQSGLSESEIPSIILIILWLLGGIFVLVAPRGKTTKSDPFTSPQYCPNCGTRLESGITFCPQCGARIGS
ncbi:MAG: zinc ribbon domain-containing protein [candidate division WOR-3 bacterium]